MSDSPIEENRQEKGLPVDLLQFFLENQKKELELRAQELEIAKQEEQHNYDVAKLSLRTQTENLERDRVYRGELLRACMKFGTVMFLMVTLLTALALWLGKEQFILEVLRVVFYGGSGIAVGAYYQKARRLSKNQNSSDE